MATFVSYTSEPAEKRQRKDQHTADAGTSTESPPRKPSPSPEELAKLKKNLTDKLHPLLKESVSLRDKRRDERQLLASLRRKLKKTSAGDKKKDLQERIQDSVKMMKDLNDLIEACEISIADVKAKHQPTIRELELQVGNCENGLEKICFDDKVNKDKVRVQLPPEAVAKYDKISKRLKAIGEILDGKDLSKGFSSLCGNTKLIKDCYQKSIEHFNPVESPVPDKAFEFLCEALQKKQHFPYQDAYASDETWHRVSGDGLDVKFWLDLKVSINDEYSKLGVMADIVIYCGNVEIIVIEERGGTAIDDTAESTIPQALVEMDCLSKKRLSMKRNLDKEYSFGVVTNCCRWYFLKLNADGTYFISDRYDLPFNICGKNNPTQLSLFRRICMRIRGLVVEAAN